MDSGPYSSGVSTTIQIVSKIWEDILNATHVGHHDHFLDAGGDSLAATVCVLRVREVFNVDVPFDFLFGDTATITELAQLIETLKGRCRLD